MWEFFLSRELSELIDMAHDRAESDKIKKKGNQGNQGNQATKGIHVLYIHQRPSNQKKAETI